MNIAAIVALVAFLTGFGAAWQVQVGNIAKLELNYANERISQQRTARETYERYSKAVSKAQDDAQSRRTAISATVDANGAELIGLRVAASTVRASAATDTARDAYADTITELFSDCSRRYIELAGTADGHVSDIQTLRDAFPK